MIRLTRLVVDSSVFISNLEAAEKNTAQSRKFFANLRTVELIIPALVVAEVVVNLRKHGWSDLQQIKRIFSNFIVLGLDEKNVYELLTSWEKNTLKTSDFIIAATTKLNNSLLITWDEKLLANKICQTMSPTQFLKSSGVAVRG